MSVDPAVTSGAPTLYDLVPYDCAPIAPTAPEHIALVSWLEGGPRPRLDGMRYLELGCGDGTNLLALAFYRPGATFVGVDASRVHVARANEAKARLGLTNVRFEVGDVRALGLEGQGEPFDFIVSHGVYSWVPADARQAILACCRERLAPAGLAYVSYNIYPGWKARGTVRDVLMRAVGGIENPAARAEKAKQIAFELRRSIPDTRHPYPALFASELEIVGRAGLSYILHEYLSEENEPVYFRDFVAAAREQGLDYVGDALVRRPDPEVPAPLRAALDAASSAEIEAAHLGDVLSNRQFRASVLCAAGARGARRASPESVWELSAAASLAPPASPPTFEPGVAEKFRGDDEAEVSVANALTKAALRVLRGLWPAGLPAPELVARATEVLAAHGAPAPSAADIGRLQRDLLLIYRTGQGELRVREPAFRVAQAPGARPMLTRLARHEAAERSSLTSPAHGLVRLDRIEHRIAVGLDGTRDVEALIGPLVRGIAAGDPPLEIGGSAITDPVLLEPLVRGLVARAVDKLGAWGLLSPSA